jgi:murein tripeptide amidase MpaA
MRIVTPKDSGRIQLLERGEHGARLAVRADRAAPKFRQWFHFGVRDAAGVPLELSIDNAAKCTFDADLEGYRVCASYDGDDWFRVPTEMDDEGALRFFHTPASDAVSYAYFPTYPRRRRLALLDHAVSTGKASAELLGETPLGDPLHVLTLGSPDKKAKRVWFVAQQHPGETMAAWFMEGLVLRLLSDEDPVARALLPRVRFHLVLGMNTDGSYLGCHRTNAHGKDLNRAWLEPSMEETPEVALVRDAIGARGVDAFFDVHGDEKIPYLFMAGCEGNPSWTKRIGAEERRFAKALKAIHPWFQTKHGYPKDAPGKGDLRCATNWVGEEHGCLSILLEMPFKELANRELHDEDENGFGPDDCRDFAAATLEALATMIVK